MRASLVVLYFCTVLPSFATEGLRGVEFGDSCQDILSIESANGLKDAELFREDDPTFLGSQNASHFNYPAMIVYRCDMDDSKRWRQIVTYGEFSKKEAQNQLAKLASDLERKFGTPDQSWNSYSFLEKVYMYFFDRELYKFMEDTFAWETRDVYVSIGIQKGVLANDTTVVSENFSVVFTMNGNYDPFREGLENCELEECNELLKEYAN